MTSDNTNPLLDFSGLPRFSLIRPEHVAPALESLLAEARAERERLLHAAEEGGRMGSVIEILVLQALALQAQDDLPHALASLARALALAEPENYVRIFVDQGVPMEALLQAAAKQGMYGAAFEFPSGKWRVMPLAAHAAGIQ